MQQDASTLNTSQLPATAAPGGESALLQVRNLGVRFGENGPAVLRSASFELKRGERVTIVGQSGSGKSTTIGAILGMLASNGLKGRAARCAARSSPCARIPPARWIQPSALNG